MEGLILSAIVAVGRNSSIGLNGEMPWNYPSEYQHFLETVSGHTILLGRVNWESNLSNSMLLSRVKSLVITSQPTIQNFMPLDFPHVCNFFHDIESALHFAKEQGVKELFVIGGEKIFSDMMPIFDRIYYSETPYDGPADRFFPEFDVEDFNIIKSKKVKATKDSPAWSFNLYQRKK